MIKQFEKIKIELEENLSLICESANSQMQEDLKRVVLAPGKRLRPALCYATYSLQEGSNLPILPLMIMLELMHSASLIHDDVVDKGMVRRGVPTINATSGDKAAVLAADYLLARAMEYLKIYKGSGINERLAKVSEGMCLGEFFQIDNLGKEISKETYFEQIKLKTANLLAESAACGGIASGLCEEKVEKLWQYGLNIGIAFQIKDDILDTSKDSKTNKTMGQDKARGLLTLPELIGNEGALKEVDNYSKKAIDMINDFKDCKAKKALIDMANTLSKRNM